MTGWVSWALVAVGALLVGFPLGHVVGYRAGVRDASRLSDVLGLLRRPRP